MSDTTETRQRDGSTDREQTDEGDATASGRFGLLGDEENLTRNLQWIGLVVLLVAALVATVQFYTNTTRAIRVWVGSGYQPLFMAAFNLAMLLFAVVGISMLARRLQGTPEEN